MVYTGCPIGGLYGGFGFGGGGYMIGGMLIWGVIIGVIVWFLMKRGSCCGDHDHHRKK